MLVIVLFHVTFYGVTLITEIIQRGISFSVSLVLLELNCRIELLSSSGYDFVGFLVISLIAAEAQ